MHEVSQAYAARPPHGTIPAIVSALFIIGLLAMVVSLFWSFYSVGLWAGLFIIGLFLLTAFVPTLLAPRR